MALVLGLAKTLRAGGFARPLIFLLSLAISGATPCLAQKYFSVDLESKTVRDKKMNIVRKNIYYTRGGYLNMKWSAGGASYYSVSSPFGFTQLYYPSTNEAVTLDPQMFKPSDELLCIFADGYGEDLGMSRSGFLLKTSRKDGDNTVRTYEPAKAGSVCTRVELVLDKEGLPVYCAYFNKKGKMLTKTYLSRYTSVKGFAFPTRVTEISWFMEKNDSTVRLDLYNNLEVDVPDAMHTYNVPPGAKTVDMKEGLKAASKKKK